MAKKLLVLLFSRKPRPCIYIFNTLHLTRGASVATRKGFKSASKGEGQRAPNGKTLPPTQVRLPPPVYLWSLRDVSSPVTEHQRATAALLARIPHGLVCSGARSRACPAHGVPVPGSMAERAPPGTVCWRYSLLCEPALLSHVHCLRVLAHHTCESSLPCRF